MDAKGYLSFVTSASDPDVLNARLLASPCLHDGQFSVAIHIGVDSAAAAFNAEMGRRPQAEWLVCTHQDVFLPAGWDQAFISAVREAEERFARLAVVGVYGISGKRRVGHLLDRGQLLKESTPLPALAESLDEILFAVRADSGLTLDPALGFDFYATDLALTAKEQGYSTAVVNAYCEHWSSLPRDRIPSQTVDRVAASGEVFERKWAHRLPLMTPCFSIERPGDVAMQCRAHSVQDHHVAQ